MLVRLGRRETRVEFGGVAAAWLKGEQIKRGGHEQSDRLVPGAIAEMERRAGLDLASILAFIPLRAPPPPCVSRIQALALLCASGCANSRELLKALDTRRP